MSVQVADILTMEGRLSRLQYFVVTLIISIACIIILSVISHIDSPLLAIGTLGLAILSIVPSTCKRFHDFDHSGWYMILLFIPAANVITAIALLLWPGTKGKGPNKYGPDSRVS